MEAYQSSGGGSGSEEFGRAGRLQQAVVLQLGSAGAVPGSSAAEDAGAHRKVPVSHFLIMCSLA